MFIHCSSTFTKIQQLTTILSFLMPFATPLLFQMRVGSYSLPLAAVFPNASGNQRLYSIAASVKKLASFLCNILCKSGVNILG